MKIEISDSIYYSLEVNYSKNRVYFSILQKWDGIEEFDTFAAEWKEIISKIKIDFTIVCDFRLMPLLSKPMEALFSQMQTYVIENGRCYIAELTAENDISNLQMARISERSNVPISRFKSKEQAEKFLDQFLEECKQIKTKI